MSHLRVTIDGQPFMDANPGEWSTTPPDLSKLNLAAAADGEKPWMFTISGIIVKTAVLAAAGQTVPSTDVTVATRPDGWDMNVTTS